MTWGRSHYLVILGTIYAADMMDTKWSTIAAGFFFILAAYESFREHFDDTTN